MVLLNEDLLQKLESAVKSTMPTYILFLDFLNELDHDQIGFNYTWRESEGGHSWNNWRLYLSEFAPMLFDNLK